MCLCRVHGVGGGVPLSPCRAGVYACAYRVRPSSDNGHYAKLVGIYRGIFSNLLLLCACVKYTCPYGVDIYKVCTVYLV